MDACVTEPTPAQLRVVLVDAREERRQLMIGVVEGDGGRASVVAEADGMETAEAAVREEGADAVVLDVRMPTPEGLRAIRGLRDAFPGLGIVVCSFDLLPETTQEAMLAGADSCLRKPASPHELVDAVEVASRREPVAPLAGVGTH